MACHFKLCYNSSDKGAHPLMMRQIHTKVKIQDLKPFLIFCLRLCIVRGVYFRGQMACTITGKPSAGLRLAVSRLVACF